MSPAIEEAVNELRLAQRDDLAKAVEAVANRMAWLELRVATLSGQAEAEREKAS